MGVEGGSSDDQLQMKEHYGRSRFGRCEEGHIKAYREGITTQSQAKGRHGKTNPH